MTRLLYLESPEAWSCECTVLSIDETSDGVAVELDVSPFYPRGSGQPTDKGTVEGGNWRLAVSQVSLDPGGIVWHRGVMTGGRVAVGNRAIASIDRDVRRQHSRLHTAGEVICAAAAELGRRWPVTAASHVPGQSRVAFATDLTADQVPEFMEALKGCFREIVARDEPVVTVLNASAEEARLLCVMDAHDIEAKRGPLRLVSPTRGFYRPCMGAHLSRTGEIGEITFRKSRLRHSELSITYELTEKTEL